MNDSMSCGSSGSFRRALLWYCLSSISPFQSRWESSFCVYKFEWVFYVGPSGVINTRIPSIRYWVVGLLVGKLENVPLRDKGIRRDSSDKYIEWSSTVVYLTCIFGISRNSKPTSLIINGGIRLCVIDWTYNVFIAIKRYVVIEYGQSYTTAASKIGKFSFFLLL